MTNPTVPAKAPTTMTEPTAEPTSPLMVFFLGLLTPIMMAGGMTDISLARLAAAEAIAAYQAQGQLELMTVGQILAFALTALDNLHLSIPPDLSLSMKLKLRGNANALNRAARDNTKWLEHIRREKPPEPDIAAMATWDEPEIEPDPTACPPTPPTDPATTEPQNNRHWADAISKHAATLPLAAEQTSPAQRKVNRLWKDVLTEVANDLTRTKNPLTNPAISKSELLRTTLIAGNTKSPPGAITESSVAAMLKPTRA